MNRLAILALVLCIGIVRSVSIRPMKNAVVNQAFVDEINKMGLPWTASINQGRTVEGRTMDEARKLCGALPGGPQLAVKPASSFTDVLASLPPTFSAIQNWPFCPSISTIRDQSACGSCWAFGAVESMSDRMCISLNVNISLSSGNLAFCCSTCGDGCDGGYPASAWKYWQSHGIVEEGCYPYPFPSCDHHIPSSSHPCPTNEYPNPPCPNKCTSKTWSGPAWAQDRHFGASAYAVSGVDQIMAEIYKHGPVEAAFDVYADFLTYKSGVYTHKSGQYVGGHAIKILGWGVQNGTPYWLCANSWNPDWGMNGFFMIKRGVDECGIEDGVVAGIPKS